MNYTSICFIRVSKFKSKLFLHSESFLFPIAFLFIEKNLDSRHTLLNSLNGYLFSLDTFWQDLFSKFQLFSAFIICEFLSKIQCTKRFLYFEIMKPILFLLNILLQQWWNTFTVFAHASPSASREIKECILQLIAQLNTDYEMKKKYIVQSSLWSMLILIRHFVNCRCYRVSRRRSHHTLLQLQMLIFEKLSLATCILFVKSFCLIPFFFCKKFKNYDLLIFFYSTDHSHK